MNPIHSPLILAPLLFLATLGLLSGWYGRHSLQQARDPITRFGARGSAFFFFTMATLLLSADAGIAFLALSH